jgi:hypothetical protein
MAATTGGSDPSWWSTRGARPSGSWRFKFSERGRSRRGLADKTLSSTAACVLGLFPRHGCGEQHWRRDILLCSSLVLRELGTVSNGGKSPDALVRWAKKSDSLGAFFFFFFVFDRVVLGLHRWLAASVGIRTSTCRQRTAREHEENATGPDKMIKSTAPPRVTTAPAIRPLPRSSGKKTLSKRILLERRNILQMRALSTAVSKAKRSKYRPPPLQIPL